MKIEDLVGQKYDHATPREGYSSADLRFAALEAARAAFEEAAEWIEQNAHFRTDKVFEAEQFRKMAGELE